MRSLSVSRWDVAIGVALFVALSPIGILAAAADDGAGSGRSWAFKAASKGGTGGGLSREDLVLLSQRLSSKLHAGRTSAKVVSRGPSSLSQLLSSPGRPRLDLSRKTAGASTSAMRIAWHESNGTPVTIDFDVAVRTSGKPLTGSGPLAMAPEQLALGLIAEHEDLFRLDAAAEELRLVRAQQDEAGRYHVTFQQQYGGLPVWHHDMVVHLQPDGTPYFLNARYGPTPNSLPTLVPQISEAQAIATARDALEKRLVRGICG